MQLQRFQKAHEFYEQAMPFLVEREAEHNLLIGLHAYVLERFSIHAFMKQLGNNADLLPYLALVRDGERIVAVTLMTPPNNLVLSHIANAAALELIAADLAAAGITPPGVAGRPADAARFAEIWARKQQVTYRKRMAQRIFQLTQVRPPAPVSGQMRNVTQADLPLLTQWLEGFYADALGIYDPLRAEESAIRWSIRGLQLMYLWEDAGVPVSMTGVSGHTPHGIRVSAVYTPRDRRKRGYASALVAAVSQRQLDEGKQFCFLYTDLANPTSNHIYQEIGYEPVCDNDEIAFETS